MEGKNIIDKKEEVLLELPTFVPINTKTPVKMKNITLKPLSKPVITSSMTLPHEIIHTLGLHK